MGTRYGLAAAAGLLLLACADTPSGPEPTGTDESAAAKPNAPPPANPEIAWSNDGIWVMNPDGSNQARVVTPSDNWIGNPAWSPEVGADSSYQLAYSDIDTSIVWMVDIAIVAGVPKGGTPRVLATEAREPAWSALGDEIAYARPGPGGGAGIWATLSRDDARSSL